MASPYVQHSLFMIMIFNFLLIFSISIDSSEDIIEPVTWKQQTEKSSHLHFYFQDKLSSPNPTAVKIIGEKGSMRFGTTFMIDDALTSGPDRGSHVVGRAQGTYSMASQSDDVALLMVVVFSFTEGEHNGSSISVLGRNHVFDDVREMPIVGGTGVFRLGRGFALAHTIWYDSQTGDATVEYNVTVLHF